MTVVFGRAYHGRQKLSLQRGCLQVIDTPSVGHQIQKGGSGRDNAREPHDHRLQQLV
jgi:hypothetical protein